MDAVVLQQKIRRFFRRFGFKRGRAGIEADLCLLVDLCPDAVAIRHGDLLVYCNASWAAMLGFRTAGEVIGRPFLDCFAAHERVTVGERMKIVDHEGPLLGGAPTIIREMAGAGGGAVFCEFNTTPRFIQFRDRPCSLVVGRDITGRLAAEELQRKRHLEFLAALDALPIGVAIRSGVVIRYINPACARSLGWTPAEMIGHDATEYLPEEDRAAATPRMMTVPPPRGRRDMRHVHADGRMVILEVNPGPMVEFEGQAGHLAALRDVTEERRLQAEHAVLRQQLEISDRLASVGTLASGVSHEVNNPLAYVISNLAFLTKGFAQASRSLEPAEAEELRQALADASDGAERVGKIVRALQTFSQADQNPSRPIDVRKVVEEAVRMVTGQMHPRTRLVVDVKGSPVVNGDERRLEQLLLNLLVNAVQALPVGDAAHHCVRISSHETEWHGTAIEVSDNGAGMPPEVRQRIFDPFFTGQPVGKEKGAGLGLSICHGIVASMGGRIEVESTLGLGTLFRVTFPSPAQAPKAESVLPVPAAMKVMVVEAGSQLRQSILLTYHGLKLLNVRTAQEAVAALNEFAPDVVMCEAELEGDGIEVICRLKILRPEVRGVLVTASVSLPDSYDDPLTIPDAILLKPWSRDGIAKALGGRLTAKPIIGM